MAQTVNLLENALRGWEDTCLLTEAQYLLGIQNGVHDKSELTGPARYWRELRKHILSLKGGDFDESRFCYPLDEGGSLFGAADFLGDLYAGLPLQLASWTISSRRVFYLSDDLLERFLAADYSHYVWSDLLWPFDSFFIQMETPVIDEIGGMTLDGLLISSVYGVCPESTLGSKEGFECLTFCSELEGKKLPTSLLSPADRMHIENDIRQRRWSKLTKRVRTFLHNVLRDVNGMENVKNLSFDEDIHFLLPVPAGFGRPICWEKDQPIGDFPLAKVIAGLCLYLEALPVDITDSSMWRTPVKLHAQRDVRKLVTDGEQICQVADFHVISPETITLFPQLLRDGPAYTVTPHWRRGYMRRAKGEGKNPNAPKTIEVKPTVIHRDQMPEGAVPGGAISIVR